jgi:pyridoxine 4-dehydrogenase
MVNALDAGTAQLGDFTVPRMGYGTMQLAGPRVFGPPADRGRAERALRTAVELGVRHLDTSDYYGPYVVNELIRETLHPYPADLVIVTKVGARRDETGGWLPALGAGDLRRAVEENLAHLGVDRIDVVNLRMIGSDVPIEEPFAVLAGLREEGLIRHLGVSNVDAAQLAQAQAVAPVVCVQNMYNVADRGDDALVDSCAEQDIAYVPYFPLGSAFRPFEAAGLEAVAKRHEVSVHRVALAWLLQRSPAILVIPGSGDPDHVTDNVAAAALTLSPDDLTELTGS